MGLSFALPYPTGLTDMESKWAPLRNAVAEYEGMPGSHFAMSTADIKENMK